MFFGVCGSYSVDAVSVLDWVNKGDWSALADVVPSMFTILCGYVVLMLLANAGAIAVNKK